MRIKFHPDKLIKPGMSENEKTEINERAKRIGQAAEILMDPVQVSQVKHS
jgi:preprotein translocase subunit Sec63